MLIDAMQNAWRSVTDTRSAMCRSFAALTPLCAASTTCRSILRLTYSARVRVTVYSQDGSRKVVRERTGGHRGFGPTVGQSVEDCIKRADRRSAYLQQGLTVNAALEQEWVNSIGVVELEGAAGAARFAKGVGRHGDFGENLMRRCPSRD